jgi:nitrate reductase (cytochrome), electron transfer subunit
MLLLSLALLAGAATAQSTKFTDGLRGDTPIPGTTHPPRLGNWVNNDQRVTRSWDRQPPIVPHRVDGYQIDKNFNKCLDCHAREKTSFSQAIPVSETHYTDRQGKVLDRISTRRYFCMQCHVAQEPAAPPVANTFRGVRAAP